MTELSCSRPGQAGQGLVEASTSCRHSLSLTKLSFHTCNFSPSHPPPPLPVPLRTPSGGVVCPRLVSLSPPSRRPEQSPVAACARPTPQPACSRLPGGARCAHCARVLLRAQNTGLPCTEVGSQLRTELRTVKCSGVRGCSSSSTGRWGELHSCPLAAHTLAVPGQPTSWETGGALLKAWRLTPQTLTHSTVGQVDDMGSCFPATIGHSSYAPQEGEEGAPLGM